MSQLYQSLNRKSNYLPTLHHKLMIIGGGGGGTVSAESSGKLHDVSAIDLMAKTSYRLLVDDPITGYITWDIAYMALGVATKLNPARFAPSIRNERERMLFAVKHGVATNPKYAPSNGAKGGGLNGSNAPKPVLYEQRDDYLDRKFKEHRKDSLFTQSCSVMMRCGGCILSESAGAGTTNRVDALNINTGDWITSLPPLKTRRYGATAVYSEQSGMFVIGGMDDEAELDVVEQWDIPRGEREWKWIPRMATKRYAPCCAVYTERSGKSGGKKEGNRAVLST